MIACLTYPLIVMSKIMMNTAKNKSKWNIKLFWPSICKYFNSFYQKSI